MQIKPSVQVKSLLSCSPGELVRPSWGGSPLSIIMRADAKFIYLMLTRIEDQPAPFYVVSDGHSQDRTVMSYGCDYEIEVDVGSSFEFSRRNLSETNGAILVQRDHYLIRATPRRNTGLDPEYFDLCAGKVFSGQRLPEFAAFPRWKLWLGSTHSENAKPLLNFDALGQAGREAAQLLVAGVPHQQHAAPLA